jgi:hypothetical protein
MHSSEWYGLSWSVCGLVGVRHAHCMMWQLLSDECTAAAAAVGMRLLGLLGGTAELHLGLGWWKSG